jgi:hypothetical protein
MDADVASVNAALCTARSWRRGLREPVRSRFVVHIGPHGTFERDYHTRAGGCVGVVLEERRPGTRSACTQCEAEGVS